MLSESQHMALREERFRFAQDIAKAPLLGRFIAIGLLVSVAYCILSYFVGFVEGVEFTSLSFGTLLLSSLLLRFGLRYAAANAMLFAACFTAVFGCAMFSGGLFSPVMPWLSIIPLIALALFGWRRTTMFWLGCALLCVFTLACLEFYNIAPTAHYNLQFRSIFGVICGLGLVVVSLLLTLVFDRAKDSALRQEEERNLELELAYEQLRTTQEQLVQQEKLASLGSLVAGVAHELNTPIGVALTTASSLQDASRAIRLSIESGDLRRSSLSIFLSNAEEMAILVCNSLQRSAALINSFKRVAINRTSESRQNFVLSVVVEDNIAALNTALNTAGVAVELAIPKSIQCDGYPGPLGQVIANLVQNALAHAFVDQENPRISIQAKQVGTYIEMRVQDNGVGIAHAIRQRIFDPFFTTKLGQGGAGLGLSISSNIVAGILGGKILLDPEVETGSCFLVVFPVSSPRAEAEEVEPQ